MAIMKNVLGIFTCFNRLTKTQRCIESLMKDPDISWDFVVADDNSNDGTKDYLEKQQNVILVNCSGNAYYSGGMRAGISEAKLQIENGKRYDYVMLLNDDVQFYDLIATKMIDVIESLQDKHNAILAGSTVDSDGNYSYGGKVQLSKIRPKSKHVMDKNRLLLCDTCNGNCIMMPTSVFMKLDNMDKHFVHSLGDYDYGYAATKKGFHIYATNFYVGICDFDHVIENTWMDPSLPIKKRIQLKEKPLGQPAKEWFHYLKKNYNILTAVVYVVNDYLKILLHR